jgi:hypothetical protein
MGEQYDRAFAKTEADARCDATVASYRGRVLVSVKSTMVRSSFTLETPA